MINYKKKAELINSPLFIEYKKIRKSIQYYIRFGNGEVIFDENTCIIDKQGEIGYTYDYYIKMVKEKKIYDYQTALKLQYFYNDTCKQDWNECRKLYNAHINRVKRVKDKVTKIYNTKKIIFITLTFNEKSLSSTSRETRREYVTTFLNNYEDYVANIDYGKKRGREHYHAVVQSEKVDNKLWKCGAIRFQRVITEVLDTEKISKYIAKLVNHAIKESTKQCRLLYPKKKKCL